MPVLLSVPREGCRETATLLWAALGAGAVLLGGFVVYESRPDAPITVVPTR